MKVLILVLLTSLISSVNGGLARPENVYGSEALLDGYCDEAQDFIDAFTLPGGRLTLKGSVSDVTHAMATFDTTGKIFSKI